MSRMIIIITQVSQLITFGSKFSAYWWISPSWQALVTIRAKLRRIIKMCIDSIAFLLPDFANKPRVTADNRM